MPSAVAALRVLIVDDDPILASGLRRGLRSQGWAITTATEARQALAQHLAEPFDVVVTDILMPDMDGIELIRLLRDAPTRPVIVAMSGGSPWFGLDFLAMSNDLGADAAIAKPFPVEALATAIQEVIAARP